MTFETYFLLLAAIAATFLLGVLILLSSLAFWNIWKNP